MPDLGKYAVHVLASYGVAIAVLGGLAWTSLSRWRRLRAEVSRREGRDG